MTAAGEALAIETVPTTAEHGLASFLRSVFEAVERLCRAHAPDTRIGIGVAGFADPERRCMFFNANLPWLERYPLADAFEQRFGGKVELDADSNAACLAEYRWGAGRGSHRFLCIVIGTGVGGGMVVNGELVRFAHGGLGDFGHVIVDPDGPACEAGCHGCAEAMIAAPALAARAQSFAPGATTREVIERAREGDENARALLARAGRWLGIALASQTVITFPDCIAVGGGVAEAGELLLAPARAQFEHSTGAFYREGVRMVAARLGWKATVMGAAALVL